MKQKTCEQSTGDIIERRRIPVECYDHPKEVTSLDAESVEAKRPAKVADLLTLLGKRPPRLAQYWNDRTSSERMFVVVGDNW